MPSRILLVALLAALVQSVRADEPWKCDFESDAANFPPAQWNVPAPVASGGWQATVVEGGAADGGRCVALKRSGTAAGAAPFGNVLRCIDAAPYRGKAISFAASVKYAGPAGGGGRAQLWLRVDRAGGHMGFFDNMGNRPVTAAEWSAHTISGPVAEDATQICFGLMVIGDAAGTAFLDNVVVSSQEWADPSLPPAELSDRSITNLVALARLYGYVRWFHPSDQAAKADWDLLAIRAVREVESCRDNRELSASLARIFAPVAPGVVVRLGRIEGEFDPRGVIGLAENAAPPQRVVAWARFGLPAMDPRNAIYSGKLVGWTPGADPTPRGAPVHGSHITTALTRSAGESGDDSDEVWCRVPFTLYTRGGRSLPAPPAEADPAAVPDLPAGFVPAATDRSTRIASIIICWNIFQHFYPYFEEVGLDWPAMLPEFLRRAAADTDEEMFLDTLRLMTAPLRDGHLQVVHPSAVTPWWLPVCWDFAGDALVVTHVPGTSPDEARGPFGAGAASGLRRGEVVLQINGVDVAERYRHVAARISGSSAWVRHRAINELRRPPTDAPVSIRVRGLDGTERIVSLTPVGVEDFLGPREPRPAVTEEVQPGVWYVDLTRADGEDFERLVPTLVGAEAIIFDMRGYPARFPVQALGHFTDMEVQCARWNVPVCAYPDGRDRAWNESRWNVPPLKPRINAHVAYITDGEAISYAETYMGIVEHYDLGVTVGRPTAATNGNVNSFALPGGYSVAFTGMRVLKHDGSPHHLVGIRPDVPVERTIEGVRAGRDEMLEAAIKAVTGAEPTKPMIRVPREIVPAGNE